MTASMFDSACGVAVVKSLRLHVVTRQVVWCMRFVVHGRVLGRLQNERRCRCRCRPVPAPNHLREPLSAEVGAVKEGQSSADEVVNK
jgi:hypothetical protein